MRKEFPKSPSLKLGAGSKIRGDWGAWAEILDGSRPGRNRVGSLAEEEIGEKMGIGGLI